MLRKPDMEPIKALLEEEKTKLTTVAEGEEAKCDFRIEKETNTKQTQTDGKEYNMNREKNNYENDKDGNNKDSNQISDEKQELSDSNILEDRQNAKQELINSNIVENGQNAKQELNDSNIEEDSQNAKQELNDSNIEEDSQNAKQELNDRNIAEDSQNAKNKETSKQNLNNITKNTEKVRDDINGRMEHTTVRNNKDTNHILKFEKQEATSNPLESKERENSQTLKMYKMEKNK